MRGSSGRMQRMFGLQLWAFPLLFALLVAGPASADVTTLRWATWGPQPVDRQLIEAFEREHPNIKIEYIASSGTGEHHTKMKVLAAGGVGADVYAVDGVYLVEFVTSGLIQPIDDLIHREDSFGLDDFFPASLPDIQYRGNTYGLPYISAPLYMVFNVDHVREAGLAKPDVHWNRETYEEYARKLTRSENDRVTRYGTTQFLQTGSHAIWPWLWSEGARMFSEDGSRFTMTDPQAVSVMDWMAELNKAGVSGGGNFAGQTASISAMYPGGFPTVTGVEWPFEWDVIIHPEGPGGQYSIWKGNVMAISAFTEHKEEAWALLKFLLGPTSAGHEIYVANKRFPPATRDQRLWELYQGSGSDPQSLYETTILLAIQHGRPLPHLLQWSTIINDTIRPALARVASGAAPARQAMEEIQAVVDNLLKNEP